MFGSFNIGTDYTFTQSDTANTAANKPAFDPSQKGTANVSGRDSIEAQLKKAASSFSRANKSSNDNNVKSSDSDLSTDSEADYLYHSDGKSGSVTNSFDALAAAVGGIGGKVTKDQLVSYLHSLTTNPKVSAENLQEVTFIKGLIAQFDTLSGDGTYITSFDGVNEPQDYKTVTSEQVTPPVDIRV